MNKIMTVLFLSGMVMVFCSIGSAWAEEEIPVVEKHPQIEITIIEEKPLVQMAILLDTSGSMSGLIDQARTELWAIVNEFIFAKRNGIEPELQVALYEYGKSSLPVKEGYIRMIVPFTTDLDKVSEELFALKTNGGDEYCGWVIKEATQSLKWSNSPDDLKVVFIAGNEPFMQGPVDYRQSCKAAVAKGIVINTIHCGPTKAGLDGKWKDGAVLADGQYLSIDQSRKAIHVAAPQDKQIAELGIKLNDTYIAYGRQGNVAMGRQTTQDQNAAAISKEAELQRAVTKSSMYYRNEFWDLVDAVNTNKVKLEDIKEEDLPEKMKKMSKEERKTYIDTQAKQRVTIQQRIQELNEQRKKYVAEEMKKRQLQGDTLGSAVIKAVRDQAEKKNFTFESSEKPLKNLESDASR
jgi:hypothetical protein